MLSFYLSKIQNTFKFITKMFRLHQRLQYNFGYFSKKRLKNQLILYYLLIVFL